MSTTTLAAFGVVLHPLALSDALVRSRAAWAITEDGVDALGRLALRLCAGDAGEFGIVIRRTAQRRGLGATSIALAERFAFDAPATATLRADIDAENVASLALFRRSGFVKETRIVAHRGTKLGVRDSIILEKLRSGSKSPARRRA